MFKKDIYIETTITENLVGKKFLGTLAGRQTYIESFGQSTYARIYESFGLSNDVRLELSNNPSHGYGLGYKKLGENYSYIPDSLKKTRQENRSFGPQFINDLDTLPSMLMRGGGFFLTVKDFSNQHERSINCFGYALSTFGEKLVNLSGKNIAEIKKSVTDGDGMKKMVSNYFNCIKEFPENGDLAIYQTTKEVQSPGYHSIIPGTVTHAGIFRNSKPNWNSPSGGTIESKWGYFLNPYVFEHDVFFVPEFYGDLVTFYRMK